MLKQSKLIAGMSRISRISRVAIVATSCVALMACGGSSNKPKPVKLSNTGSTFGGGSNSTTPTPSPTPTPDETGGQSGGSGSGGGEMTPTPTPTPSPAPVDTFELGGTVEGLSDGRIVISLNGDYDLTINSNDGTEKNFTFADELEQGESYEVTIDQDNNTDNKCAVFDGEGNVGSFDIDDIVIKCVEKEVLYAINVGGNRYNAGGIQYSADNYSNGGVVPDISAEPIAGTADDALYQAERYGEATDFSYDFPVEPGSYDVTLHFSELYFDGLEGRPTRSFDVRIEGDLELNNYNPYQESGNQRFAANVEQFDGVEVADNDDELNIEFLFGPGNPQVSAIVIMGYPEITRN